MFQAFGNGRPILGPEDLRMMQTLLQDFCTERGFEISGLDAQEAARELVNWFQIGVTQQSQLRELLRSRD